MKDLLDGKFSKYGSGKVPVTPSSNINAMLQTRFGKPFSNILHFCASQYICLIFRLITSVYSQLHPHSDKRSTPFWFASCFLVSCGILIKTYLLYNMLIISAMVLKSVLYYMSILLCMGGIGIGSTAAVMFNTDANRGNSPSYRSQSLVITEGESGNLTAKQSSVSVKAD